MSKNLGNSTQRVQLQVFILEVKYGKLIKEQRRKNTHFVLLRTIEERSDFIELATNLET